MLFRISFSEFLISFLYQFFCLFAHYMSSFCFISIDLLPCFHFSYCCLIFFFFGIQRVQLLIKKTLCDLLDSTMATTKILQVWPHQKNCLPHSRLGAGPVHHTRVLQSRTQAPGLVMLLQISTYTFTCKYFYSFLFDTLDRGLI